MADQQTLSKEEEQQINALHEQLASKPHAGAAAAAAPAAAAPSLADVCAIWRKIKPNWGIIIKVIRHIPIYGGKIADILEKLASILNLLCP